MKGVRETDKKVRKMKYRDIDQVAETVSKAHEDALRNTNVRLCVYISGESEDAYIFEDIAGGNSEPISVWEGKDKYVCEFCNQFWHPEDSDENFRNNLLSYLNNEQTAELKARETEQEAEVSNNELKEMFPSAYDEYCEEIIQNELSEFEPFEYINKLSAK